MFHSEIVFNDNHKCNLQEQSNDYRVVTFGSGGVGKSSLGIIVLLTPENFVFTAVIRPPKNRACRKRKIIFSRFGTEIPHTKLSTKLLWLEDK